MASPHLDIPLLSFTMGPAIGLIPYNFISCKAGLMLHQMRSKGEIIDSNTTIQLVVVAILGAVLLPRSLVWCRVVPLLVSCVVSHGALTRVVSCPYSCRALTRVVSHGALTRVVSCPYSCRALTRVVLLLVSEAAFCGPQTRPTQVAIDISAVNRQCIYVASSIVAQALNVGSIRPDDTHERQ